MIWRSMGKAHDWELEKFRLAKKFPDKGNKRRFFKNLFRLFKHPMGYMYWKSYNFFLAKGRLPVTAMGFGFFFMLFNYKCQSGNLFVFNFSIGLKKKPISPFERKKH